MHPRHAHMKRVGIGERPQRHQRRHHGNTRLFDELRKLRAGISLDHPTTDIQHRATGLRNEVHRLLDLPRVRRRRRPITRKLQLNRPLKLSDLILNILRHVDKHRTRTPSGCQVECLRNQTRDVLNFGHHEVVLRDGEGHPANISFLERVGSQ